MIFIRYLARNILTSFAITTLILVVILASNLAVRLLTDIHEDGIYGGYLLPLIFFNLLDDIPLLLPLCLLIGVYLALSRLHRNQEIIAMQALGVSFKELFQAVLLISIPVCIVVSVLSLYISPLSMSLNHQYRNEFDLGNQLKSLIARSFALSLDSKHVIYVDENNQLLADEINQDQWPMKGVFIYSDLSPNQQERVIIAEKAKQSIKQKDGIETRFLILSNGEIYTFENNQLVELLDFDRYDMTLSQSQSTSAVNQSLKTTSSYDLYASSNQREKAEFYWRLSSAVNLIMAGLLALLLSTFKPRKHSFKKLFLGILIYIVYHNLLTSARYWVVDSIFSAGFLFFSIHFLMFLSILVSLLIQKGFLKGFLNSKTTSNEGKMR